MVEFNNVTPKDVRGIIEFQIVVFQPEFTYAHDTYIN